MNEHLHTQLLLILLHCVLPEQNITKWIDCEAIFAAAILYLNNIFLYN